MNTPFNKAELLGTISFERRWAPLVTALPGFAIAISNFKVMSPGGSPAKAGEGVSPCNFGIGIGVGQEHNGSRGGMWTILQRDHCTSTALLGRHSVT